jgi:hypothetical protein
MASFPSFINPITPGGIQPVGLNQRALDVSPLIKSIQRKNEQERAPKKGKTAAAKKEDLLKGRRGAVSQYYRELNKATNDIAMLVQVHGIEVAQQLSEYQKKVNLVEYITSPEHQNTIFEETKDVEKYEDLVAQGEGGNMFHLGQFVNSGGLNTVTHKQMLIQQNYGDTPDLPNFKKDGQIYNPNLNMNPGFHTIKDAHELLDTQLFGPADNQNKAIKNTSTLAGHIVAAVNGDYSGILKQNTTELNDYKSLGLSMNQSTKRILDGSLDISDPLVAGYLQGFLQNTGGGYQYNNIDIRDEDGTAGETFYKAFKHYVTEDLKLEMRKRYSNAKTHDKQFTKDTKDRIKSGKTNKVNQDALGSQIANNNSPLVLSESKTAYSGASEELINQANELSKIYGLGDMLFGDKALFREIIDKDKNKKFITNTHPNLTDEDYEGTNPSEAFKMMREKVDAMTTIPSGAKRIYGTGENLRGAYHRESPQYKKQLQEYKKNAKIAINAFEDKYDAEYEATQAASINTLGKYTTYNIPFSYEVVKELDKIYKGKDAGDALSGLPLIIASGSGHASNVLIGTTISEGGWSANTVLGLTPSASNWFGPHKNDAGEDVPGGYYGSNGVLINTAEFKSVYGDNLLEAPSKKDIEERNAYQAAHIDSPNAAMTSVGQYSQKLDVAVTDGPRWWEGMKNTKVHVAAKDYEPEIVNEYTSKIQKVRDSAKRNVNFTATVGGSISTYSDSDLETLSPKAYEKKWGIDIDEAKKIQKFVDDHGGGATDKIVTEYMDDLYIDKKVSIEKTYTKRVPIINELYRDKSWEEVKNNFKEPQSFNNIFNEHFTRYSKPYTDADGVLHFKPSVNITGLLDKSGVLNNKTKRQIIERNSAYSEDQIRNNQINNATKKEIKDKYDFFFKPQ